MIGRVIDGRYSVVRLLGQGGMGAVYEARHTGTGRRVALKIILEKGAQSEQQLARFQREARAVGAAESDHIAQVFDTGCDVESGAPYIAMEFLDGEDVESLIDRLGPLPVDLALRIAMQAALALESAHGAGVVHRDIKPANMFLARKSDGRRVVKLLDFGIAKFLPREGDGHALTKTGAMVGSPLYMSPEQARGGETLDERTDLWSLGITMFETLCGTRPNEQIEGLGALLIAICSMPPPSVQTLAPWIPTPVASVIRKALMLDRKERFASATQLVRALSPLLPVGYDIVDAMLVPVSAEERSVVADPSVASSTVVSAVASPASSTLPERGSAPSVVPAMSAGPSSALSGSLSTAPVSTSASGSLTSSTSSSFMAPVPSTTLSSTDGTGTAGLPTRGSSKLITGAIAAALLATTVGVTWKLARSSTDTKIVASPAEPGPSVEATPPVVQALPPTASAMVVVPASATAPPTASVTAPSSASAAPSSSAPASIGKRPSPRPSAQPGSPPGPVKKPISDEETSRK